MQGARKRSLALGRLPAGAAALLLCALVVLFFAGAAEARPHLERVLGAPELVLPGQLAVDGEGNVYVIDGQRIVKYRSDGAFVDRFGGEGAGVQLHSPRDIAVGPSGAIYVVDGLQRVVKLDARGELVWQWGGGDGELSEPCSVAVDAAENVYVAELGSNRVRKFSPEGELVAGWGGHGSGDGEFDGPTDVAVGPDGSVYVADAGNHRIQRFGASGDFQGKWGSEGAGDGELSSPRALATDADGNVYVADSGNHRVQVFDEDGGFIRKWGRYDEEDPAGLGYILGIGVDAAGGVYLSDSDNARIKKFDAEGGYQLQWGAPTFGSARKAVADGDGHTYVLDGAQGQVLKLDPEGRVILRIGEQGALPGQLLGPEGLDLDEERGLLYVADTANHRVQAFDADDGSLAGVWGGPGFGDGEFHYPLDVAVAADASVYVADSGNARIQRLSPEGELIAKWGGYGNGDGRFHIPARVAIAPDGSVYVADSGNNRIQRFGPGGEFLGKWGSEGSGDGGFEEVVGVAVRDDGLVYVADQGDGRIQVFRPNGAFIGRWGSSGTGKEQFSWISGIAFTPQGELLVSDRALGEVKRYRFPGPEVRIDRAPSDPSSDPRPAFAFSSPERDVAFECSLVPASSRPEFGPCSGPGGSHTPDEPLKDGRYTFSVRATDAFGDATSDPPQHTFTLSTGAPKTTITAGPAGPTSNPRPRFEFEADENDVTFECSLVPAGSGPEFGACSEEGAHQPPSDLDDGGYTFTVRATDAAGNVEADPPSRAFTVITSAPRTAILSGPAGRTADPRPVFAFTSDTEGATFECSLVRSGQEPRFGPCTGSQSHRPEDDLPDGAYTFTVRAVGSDGVADPEPPQRSFIVDTTPPQVTITAGPAQGARVRATAVRFKFAADEEAAFKCRLDDGEWEPCSSPLALDGLADGEHTLIIRATDSVGNMTEHARSFLVVAAACERAQGALADAKRKLSRAEAKLKQAKRKLRRLKRRGAAKRKVRRARRAVRSASAELRRARAEQRRAQRERKRSC